MVRTLARSAGAATTTTADVLVDRDRREARSEPYRTIGAVPSVMLHARRSASGAVQNTTCDVDSPTTAAGAGSQGRRCTPSAGRTDAWPEGMIEPVFVDTKFTRGVDRFLTRRRRQPSEHS